MRPFTFLITDDRYSVPSLAIFVTESDARAAHVAWDMLMESDHHKAIEVLDQNRAVYRANRPEAYSGPEGAPAAQQSKAAPVPGTSGRVKWLFQGSPRPAWYRRAV